MNHGFCPRKQIKVGTRVEWYKRNGEPGFVVRFDGNRAVVRYDDRDYHVHPDQLTWLPSEEEMEATKEALRREDLANRAKMQSPRLADTAERRQTRITAGKLRAAY